MGKEEEEWKSSHDRFVEALERVITKQEREQFGFVVEMSRDELMLHLKDRAAHYAFELETFQEKKGATPIRRGPLPGQMYGPPLSKEERDEIESVARTRMIRSLRAKAEMFRFFASHLPKTKAVYVLGAHDLGMLELVTAHTYGPDYGTVAEAP